MNHQWTAEFDITVSPKSGREHRPDPPKGPLRSALLDYSQLENRGLRIAIK